MYISWVHVFWLSCTSSRSFFSARGSSHDNLNGYSHTAGPKYGAFGTKWSRLNRTVFWPHLNCHAGASRLDHSYLASTSEFQAIWHFEAKCQSQLNIPPSSVRLFCLLFYHFFVLSVQRLQSRALEPLMVVYWGFGKRLAAITTVGCPRWLRQNARGKCQRCEETK